MALPVGPLVLPDEGDMWPDVRLVATRSPSRPPQSVRTVASVPSALSRFVDVRDGASTYRGSEMDEQQLVVADVMTLDPVVVHIDATIEQAAVLLNSNSISGLPVIDDGGALVGVISQTDLIAVMDSPVGRLIRTKPSGLCVGELMSSPAITIRLTGSLIEAARTMLESRVHRLVAIDDAGRPVGVLSAIDFVRLYAEN